MLMLTRTPPLPRRRAREVQPWPGGRPAAHGDPPVRPSAPDRRSRSCLCPVNTRRSTLRSAPRKGSTAAPVHSSPKQQSARTMNVESGLTVCGGDTSTRTSITSTTRRARKFNRSTSSCEKRRTRVGDFRAATEHIRIRCGKRTRRYARQSYAGMRERNVRRLGVIPGAGCAHALRARRATRTTAATLGNEECHFAGMASQRADGSGVGDTSAHVLNWLLVATRTGREEPKACQTGGGGDLHAKGKVGPARDDPPPPSV